MENIWTMGESLIQKYFVNEEGSSCKFLKLENIMYESNGKVLANFVPAVAVIQGGLALFVIIGRKGCVGSLKQFMLNFKC